MLFFGLGLAICYINSFGGKRRKTTTRINKGDLNEKENQQKGYCISHFLLCMYFFVGVCLCFVRETHWWSNHENADWHFDYFSSCGAQYRCLGITWDYKRETEKLRSTQIQLKQEGDCMTGLKTWGWILFATSFVIFWSCVLFVPMNMNRLSGGAALLLMISFVCFVLSITVWAIVRAINEIRTNK